MSTLEDRLAAAIKPLQGLLKEHSACYRDGNCKHCRTLRAQVVALLAEYDASQEGRTA